GDARYDRLAKEFTRLLLVAYSATAIWGAVLVFFLATLYPRFWAYLTAVFGPSMWAYAALFFLESFTLYLYYYGWDRWKHARAKWAHWGLGLLLNVWGTISSSPSPQRSEEHTSELQSRFDLVCRLLLEKKKHRDNR